MKGKGSGTTKQPNKETGKPTGRDLAVHQHQEHPRCE